MMRAPLLIAAALLAASCTTSQRVTTTTLTAADAATSLSVGETLYLDRVETARVEEGMDPVVPLTLRHANGATLNFQQGNHTNNDLAAQAPDGPLSQIMGLSGDQLPTLYNATRSDNHGASFICGAEGPVAIGIYEADGAVQIVGLRQNFEFETLPNGEVGAIPFSPDQVCARLRFR